MWLRPLTGDILKQYCHLLLEVTLLDQTRRGAVLAVDAARTVVVVVHRHEHFYQPLQANGLGSNTPFIRKIVTPRPPS